MYGFCKITDISATVYIRPEFVQVIVIGATPEIAREMGQAEITVRFMLSQGEPLALSYPTEEAARDPLKDAFPALEE